ncbi:MAG: polysaccharide biosynthesis C-terminal domain-containing protein [Eubacterium ventriosum]
MAILLEQIFSGVTSCWRIRNDSCLALPFSLSFHYTWLHLTLGWGLLIFAFIHNVIGVVIRLASLWFGVPVFGVEGYLIGLLISNLVVTLLHSFYIHKYVDFNFSAISNVCKAYTLDCNWSDNGKISFIHI